MRSDRVQRVTGVMSVLWANSPVELVSLSSVVVARGVDSRSHRFPCSGGRLHPQVARGAVKLGPDDPTYGTHRLRAAGAAQVNNVQLNGSRAGYIRIHLQWFLVGGVEVVGRLVSGDRVAESCLRSVPDL
jgi:hypothetical protein